MSRAPIWSGTTKLANPSSHGITAKKIIVVPCIVKSALYAPGPMKSPRGWASWIRIKRASSPARAKKTAEVTRYMIPIFLWSTVVNQSRRLPGGTSLVSRSGWSAALSGNVSA